MKWFYLFIITFLLTTTGCELVDENSCSIKFNNSPGTYEKNVYVTIDSSDSSIPVYYTIDGKEPSQGTSSYNDQIAVEGLGKRLTIKAAAIEGGKKVSDIISLSLTVYPVPVVNDGYSNDDDYKMWIYRFFQGYTNILVDEKGWHARQDDVVSWIDSKSIEASEKMTELGSIICEEWAKSNYIRKINTTHVSDWGEELDALQNESDDVIIAKMDEIKAEVLALIE